MKIIQFLNNQYLRVINNRQSRPAQILLTDCVSCLNLGAANERLRTRDRKDCGQSKQARQPCPA